MTALGFGVATFTQQRRQAAERDAESVRALDAAIEKSNFKVAGTDSQNAAPAAAVEPNAQATVGLAELGALAILQQTASAPANFLPDQSDSNALECDRLADHPSDPVKIGEGVAMTSIDAALALRVCEQAASVSPARPRYQYAYGRALEAASRFGDAVRQYGLAAQAGYALADMNLGFAYESGNGVVADRDLAGQFLSRADAAGVPNLRAVVGDLYLYRTPNDYPRAKSWYESAIERNESQGYAGLAILYDLGLGVDKDRVKGAQLAQKAAELGNVNGMFWLARHLRDGEGVEKDLSAACGWFDKTARANYAYGQLEAGRCFYTGDGADRNHGYAFYWLIRAAEAGIPEAQELVGDMYDSGDGVAADETEAVGWYRKAALQGDLYGMFQLGAHLRQGKGAAWSEAEAMKWFAKAADAGFAAAQSSLAEGYLLGLGQEAGQGHQDYQLAAQWFGEATKKGEGFAFLNLGVMYENGWGVAQDLEHARQLYLQAGQSSNPGAAKMGQQYAADLASITSDPQPSSLVRTKKQPSNADAWVAIIVGAVALGAVAEILGHSRGGSAQSNDVTSDSPSVDWSPSTWTPTPIDWGASSSSSPAPEPLHPYYPYQQWRTPNGDLTNPNIAWR